MEGRETSKNVNAREAIEDIRGPMPNGAVMEKYKITPAGFADLLKQLYLKKLISEEDLTRRGIRFRVVKPPAKEKPPEPEPVIPPEPMHEEEGFLDTVELTELLSFKPEEPPQQKEKPPPEPPPVIEEDSDPSEKKGKFSITGLFKKSR